MNMKIEVPEILEFEIIEYGIFKVNLWNHEFENKVAGTSLSCVKFTKESYLKYGLYADLSGI